MTSAAEETDCNGKNSREGAKMEEKDRDRAKRLCKVGLGINLHQVRYSLGTCQPSQIRGPVEGRLITMAADGGRRNRLLVAFGGGDGRKGKMCATE